MKKIRIICRNSRLSLLQAGLVRQKILQAMPDLVIEIIGHSSRGDRESQVSLAALDGTDFFTEDIFNALAENRADIAVHSLKDMSAEHFFSHNAFAVVDREDVRDVAIFNQDIIERIQSGKTVTVGTCSPRRETMAIEFLKKALPQIGKIDIHTKPIRGNVETRLKQLAEGLYDATILATAGLNRLLKSERDNEDTIPDSVAYLLSDKKMMLLPLFECVPAPCQGAIVAEAHPKNEFAVDLLKLINDSRLFAESFAEKKKAFEYGTGCLQKFGVTTIRNKTTSHLYAAGEDSKGTLFNCWTNLPELPGSGLDLFPFTDNKNQFFQFEWRNATPHIKEPIVFVSNSNTVRNDADKERLSGKRVWAAGTETWYKLAKLGIWVDGSADGLGFEALLEVLATPLFRVDKNDLCLLTHDDAAKRWTAKGFQAVSNYRLNPMDHPQIVERIKHSKYVFWSSFSQYEHYGKYVSNDARHICAGGETAFLLTEAGVKPIVFPTIKSFEQWRKSSIQSLSVA